MKVLSVLKPYVDTQNVGAAWVGTYLTNELSNVPGVEVGLATALDDYSMYDDKVVIHRIDGLMTRSTIKKLIEKSVRIYNDEHYNVMHIHVNSLAVLKWLAEIVPDSVNMVYTLHNSLILGRSKIVYGIPYASKLSNKNNIRLVAVSNFMQGIWKEFVGADPDSTINNLSTVYLDIKEEPIELVSTQDKLDRVLLCGRITPDKRFDKALEYLGSHDIPTLFVGEGYIINKNISDQKNDEYIDTIESIIDSYPSIQWVQKMNHKDLLKEMSRSKVVLHTSTMESYGLVPVESLYSGTSVICFEPTPSIVEHEDKLNNVATVLRFDKGTRWTRRMDSVGRVIEEYMTNPIYSTYVRQIYNSVYGGNQMVNDYLRVYESLQ